MAINKFFRADHRQTKSLVKAGRIASINAVRHSKALDLNVTYINNGVIYEELPSGEKKVVGKIDNDSKASFTLIKGMLLHAK
jgi:hypothetical protein